MIRMYHQQTELEQRLEKAEYRYTSDCLTKVLEVMAAMSLNKYVGTAELGPAEQKVLSEDGPAYAFVKRFYGMAESEPLTVGKLAQACLYYAGLLLQGSPRAQKEICPNELCGLLNVLAVPVGVYCRRCRQGASGRSAASELASCTEGVWADKLVREAMARFFIGTSWMEFIELADHVMGDDPAASQLQRAWEDTSGGLCPELCGGSSIMDWRCSYRDAVDRGETFESVEDTRFMAGDDCTSVELPAEVSCYSTWRNEKFSCALSDVFVPLLPRCARPIYTRFGYQGDKRLGIFPFDDLLTIDALLHITAPIALAEQYLHPRWSQFARPASRPVTELERRLTRVIETRGLYE